MLESPFFFARGTTRLFGLVHEPADEASRTGFVLSHPFAEEKLWGHRVFVSVARALAARGHAVLRFDYTGAGDSEGGTAETSLATHLDDLTAAVQALAARRPALERIGLLGLRFGASLAALVAERAADAPAGSALAKVRGAPLILWDPVLDGSSYLQEVLRANLSAQLATHGKVLVTREMMGERIISGGVVNVDGYEIGRALYESLGVATLLDDATKRHTGPVFVAAITPPGRPPKPQPALESFARSYRQGTPATVEEHPFWREIKQFYGRAERLQSATLTWLEQSHG